MFIDLFYCEPPKHFRIFGFGDRRHGSRHLFYYSRGPFGWMLEVFWIRVHDVDGWCWHVRKQKPKRTHWTFKGEGFWMPRNIEVPFNEPNFVRNDDVSV